MRLDDVLLCGWTTFCLSTICCWGLGWSPLICGVNQPGLTPHGVHNPQLPTASTPRYSPRRPHPPNSPRRPHSLTPHSVHTPILPTVSTLPTAPGAHTPPTASTPPHSPLAVPPRFSPAATRFRRALVLAPLVHWSTAQGDTPRPLFAWRGCAYSRTLGSACTMVRPPALRVSPTAPSREDGKLKETQGWRAARRPRLRSSGLPVGPATGGGERDPAAPSELSGTRATGPQVRKGKKAREGNPHLL